MNRLVLSVFLAVAATSAVRASDDASAGTSGDAAASRAPQATRAAAPLFAGRPSAAPVTLDKPVVPTVRTGPLRSPVTVTPAARPAPAASEAPAVLPVAPSDAKALLEAALPIFRRVAGTVTDIRFESESGHWSVSPASETGDPAAVDVRGAPEALPVRLRQAARREVSASAALLNKPQDVIIRATPETDGSFHVLSLQSAPAETPAPVLLNPPTLAPNVAGPAGDGAQAPVRSPTLFERTALALVQWTELLSPDDASAPPAATTPARLSIKGLSGAPIVIRWSAARPDGLLPLRIEARFGDLPFALQTDVRARLSDYGGDAWIKSETPVHVDVVTASDGEPEPVAVAMPDPKTGEDLTLWSRPAVTAMPPAPEGPKGPLPKPAPAPAASGLAPVLTAATQRALGLPGGSFDMAAHGGGVVRLDAKPATDRKVSLEWRGAAEGDEHAFTIVGRTVDFTDAVRAEVEKKLREAKDAGAGWADAALKGDRFILVDFAMETAPNEDPKLHVTRVSPTVKEAAREWAHQMGVPDDLFFVMTYGSQALIVLNEGAVAKTTIGGRALRLTSPDGDVKIIVRNAEGPRTGLLAMMSRRSLKANRAAIAGFKTDGESVDDMLRRDADSPQFLVRFEDGRPPTVFVRPASEAGLPSDRPGEKSADGRQTGALDAAPSAGPSPSPSLAPAGNR